ncbi:MAG: SpoIVB peptidase [Lachnospiraceae bacterium]|nr:SpoIVB peptidase [Lachnospiraceae bacterium]
MDTFFQFGESGDRMRRKIYKCALSLVLMGAMVTIMALGYKNVYEKIPGRIRLKAGVEQILDLNVPVEGVITKNAESPGAVTVSGKQSSNIPSDAIYIDLSGVVTLKADTIENYRMDLKLFGFIPFKQVDIEVIQDMMVTPVGEPIGIYVKTEGLLVIGVGEFDDAGGRKQSPAKYLLKTGDYILKVNDESVSEKEDFMEVIEDSEGEKIALTIRRDDKEFNVNVEPVKNMDGEYKLGIWVRDNAQGVGTMTFVDDLGNFGALGHGISDVDTGTLLTLESGSLYKTEIIAIQKGKNGEPGEMTGMIEYANRNILGEITANTSKGIYGTCNAKIMSDLKQKAMPIGLKQDVKEGKAQILCNVDGEAKYYDVLIKDIYLEHENVNRGMLLKITDPQLLAITGGIIQGMSGAPIIQDGKLIGAVTHVLVQDSTSGYGIFVENMLNHSN